MLKAFDDWRSLVHIAIGMLASLDIAVSIAISISYSIYQFLDQDDPNEKKGDIIEYIAGVIVGFVVKKTLGL